MVKLPALANCPSKRGSIDMSKFDEIFELAIDNYGIFTAAEALKMGAEAVKMGVDLKDVHEWVYSARGA